MKILELAQLIYDSKTPDDDVEYPTTRCVYYEDSIIDSLNDLAEDWYGGYN